MIRLPTPSRRYRFYAFLACLLVIVATLLNYEHIERTAAPALHTRVQTIDSTKVALVLGTSKYLQDSTRNPYYAYRLQAALSLWEAGKVEYFLLSGDNGTSTYNEPRDMRDDLLAAGVPAERLVLDYAGFRTLDSVVRAKKVFGQQDLIVVSQAFHVARAISIGQGYGMRMQGYIARDLPHSFGWKVMLREYFARVKMRLDLWFDVGPRFLGEEIVI